MTLWKWALAAYPRPGVESACLALQDRHGVNVCYLLWAAWGEAEARPLDLDAGHALARAWEGEVAAPLRTARRQLKTSRPAVADAPRERLRADLKGLELSAERLLLDSLEALAAGPRVATLVEAAALWTPPPPLEAVQALGGAITNPVYAAASEPRA